MPSLSIASLVPYAQTVAVPLLTPLANGVSSVATKILEATESTRAFQETVVSPTAKGAVDKVSSVVGSAAATANQAIGNLVERMLGTVSAGASSEKRTALSTAKKKQPQRAKRVFVAHGRHSEAYEAMKELLKTLGLTAYDFDDQLESVENASPFVGDVVRSALLNAQAIIVLFTAEELAQLSPTFYHSQDNYHPVNVRRWQARPNVIFEAGMALAKSPRRTLLVALGPDVQFFSDMDGRHIMRVLEDSEKVREKLAKKLLLAGCAVRRSKDQAPLQSGRLRGALDRRQENPSEPPPLSAPG
jgi:predicted nucleotide-binding protein